MRQGLTIKKGGKLIETKWVYDESKKQGLYQEQDVTSRATQMMFERCDLEEGVTLKDIFLLLNTELKIFDTIIGNWCEQIVTEGLTKPSKSYTGEYDPDEMEYLELRFDLTYDEETPTFAGHIHPDFGAQGYELKEDKLFDWKNEDGTPAVQWSKGHRIPWSVSLSKANDLINIPIKLNKEVIVTNENVHDEANWMKEITRYQGISYSLGQILYSIIWELSWHGAPEDRDTQREELFTIAEEIKNKEKDKL